MCDIRFVVDKHALYPPLYFCVSLSMYSCVSLALRMRLFLSMYARLQGAADHDGNCMVGGCGCGCIYVCACAFARACEYVCVCMHVYEYVCDCDCACAFVCVCLWVGGGCGWYEGGGLIAGNQRLGRRSADDEGWREAHDGYSGQIGLWQQSCWYLSICL